jgi:hypothetical protein
MILGIEISALTARRSTCQITPTGTGGYHLALNDKPTTSIGEVKRIYPMRRDAAMLSFPCYEVNARFDHRMADGSF